MGHSCLSSGRSVCDSSLLGQAVTLNDLNLPTLFYTVRGRRGLSLLMSRKQRGHEVGRGFGEMVFPKPMTPKASSRRHRHKRAFWVVMILGWCLQGFSCLAMADEFQTRRAGTVFTRKDLKKKRQADDRCQLQMDRTLLWLRALRWLPLTNRESICFNSSS